MIPGEGYAGRAMDDHEPRRRFLKTMAAGYAATAFGYPANETIGIGCIGTGGRAQVLMKNLESVRGTRITAVCDVRDENLERARQIAGPAAFASRDYHALLDRTKKALPNVKLVICEPFGVKGVSAVNDKWYPTFDLFRKAAKDVAKEYDAAFVPYQAAFDKALELAPGNYWTLDGVHPSIAGEALMARTWMESIG